MNHMYGLSGERIRTILTDVESSSLSFFTANSGMAALFGCVTMVLNVGRFTNKECCTRVVVVGVARGTKAPTTLNKIDRMMTRRCMFVSRPLYLTAMAKLLLACFQLCSAPPFLALIVIRHCTSCRKPGEPERHILASHRS